MLGREGKAPQDLRDWQGGHLDELPDPHPPSPASLLGPGEASEELCPGPEDGVAWGGG